jgi:pyroglutamyl-peptidase
MPGSRIILISGFEPFGGEVTNPAAETASALDGREFAPGVRARSVILPVTWDGAIRALVRTAAGRSIPDRLAAVVMLGQAGGYAAIGLERVAVNVSNGKDNTGAERVEAPIVTGAAGGPAAYLATLPLESIQKRVEATGLPAFISNSAGTYLCNYLFYSFMHYLATAWTETGSPSELPSGTTPSGAGARPKPLAGFVHVPYLPEQAVGKKPIPPSMSRGDIERAVLAVLEATAEAAEEAAAS